VRADHYNDYGMQYSGRAALVYRATDRAIFKLLYGSAFRAPSLSEAYQNGHINFRAGDAAIEPEETNTYEAVAIYAPDALNKFVLNLFYSKLYNVIDLEEQEGTPPGYANYRSRISKGIEFEYFFKTLMKHDFYFNATYLDTQYTVPFEYTSAEGVDLVEEQKIVDMPDISTLMFKAMYLYRFSPELTFGTTWRYYNETTSTSLQWVTTDPDTDPTVDAVHIFDLTASYRFKPESTLTLTVKNLFDADVMDPSYYYSTNGGVYRDGTNFFLSFETKF